MEKLEGENEDIELDVMECGGVQDIKEPNERDSQLVCLNEGQHFEMKDGVVCCSNVSQCIDRIEECIARVDRIEECVDKLIQQQSWLEEHSFGARAGKQQATNNEQLLQYLNLGLFVIIMIIHNCPKEYSVIVIVFVINSFTKVVFVSSSLTSEL